MQDFEVPDMPDETGNRRGFIRVPFRTEVEIEAGDRILRSEKEIDVSMSGLRLSGEGALLAPGVSCRVSIILPTDGDRISIEARGRVIRSESGSLSLEFTELDFDSYHHLRQLILSNTDNPEKAEEEFIAHWGIRRPGPEPSKPDRQPKP